MDLKAVSENIFLAGVDSVLPDKMIRSQLHMAGNTLNIKDQEINLSDFENIYVIGAGKASSLMAKGLEDVLGDRITGGQVVVKYGHSCNLRKVETIEAAHPVPDINGIQATKKILNIAGKATEKDLVFCLISGGASALLADCPKGTSLDDLIEVNKLLLKCGADINEMNAVRKHISRVKGGELARMIFPATCISLILSDVIGDSTEVIASGPTSPDSSTFADAIKVLEKYRIKDKFPAAMLDYLEKGASGCLDETPKIGNPLFDNVRNIIIGNNGRALEEAGKKATEMGFQVKILTSGLKGNLAEAADFVLKAAIDVSKDINVKKPVCLLAGGEPTVRVTGKGTGGRNQHFALYCATRLKCEKGITLLCAGTDGTDGPTEFAGAVVDCNTANMAIEKGVDPRSYLDNFDSCNFFGIFGGHVKTGSTMTNVMDLIVVLIE